MERGESGDGSAETKASDPSLARSLVLALVAGLVLGESAPPNEQALPALLFGPALLFACDAAVRRPGRGAAIGLLAGVGFGLRALLWIAPAIRRFAHFGAASAIATNVLVVLAEALPCALACATYAAIAERRRPVLFAACLGLAFSLCPMLFPWRPIAIGLPAAPIAAWLGIGGGAVADFVLVLPGALLLSPRRRDRWLALPVLAIVLGLGAWRIDRVREEARHAETLRVGVIQPNVGLATGLDRRRRGERLASLRAATERSIREGASVVLWPESAHPYVFPRERTTDLPPPHDTRAAALRSVLLVGATSERDPCTRWNGVLAFGADGRLAGRVDKQRRMPLGDYVPWRRAGCRDLQPAEALAPLAVAHEAGVLVCYDEVEPGPARARASQGARWLAGFTNDAWYDGTRQPYLHERVARMRAIEAGRDLVRAVNTGLSGHYGADGSIRARLPVDVRGRLLVRVPLRTATVPAAWLGLPLTLGLLVFVLVAAAQRLRTSSSGGGR